MRLVRALEGEVLQATAGGLDGNVEEARKKPHVFWLFAEFFVVFEVRLLHLALASLTPIISLIGSKLTVPRS